MKTNKTHFLYVKSIILISLLSWTTIFAMGSTPPDIEVSYESNNDNPVLPVQPFHLFTKIDNSPSTAISISYINYQGKTITGTLDLPNQFSYVKPKLTQAFNDLQKNKFPIQELSPLSMYKNVYEALKNNATFLFATTDGGLWLVINPVNNPLIVRKEQSQATASAHLHAFEETTQSSELAIFPASGILSVNQNYTSTQGKIESTVIKILAQQDFDYTKQPDQNPNELFFGLFSYTSSTVAYTKKSEKKSLRMDNYSLPEQNVFIFTNEPLPEAIKQSLIKSGAWKPGCPVGLERLHYVRFGYHNFEGDTKQGALITADVLGASVLNIFTDFYKQGIAIEQPGGGSVGGTGMFNCRPITGEAGFSLHSYGTALDLSFYRNPYVGIYVVSNNSSGLFATGIIIPASSQLAFIDRNEKQTGFNEPHVDYLASKGLAEWGGTWLNRTDYMHFQTSPFFSYLFPLIDYESGLTLLTLEKQGQDNILHKFSLEVTEVSKWQTLAQLYSKTFAVTLVENITAFDKLGEDGLYKLIYQKLQAD